MVRLKIGVTFLVNAMANVWSVSLVRREEKKVHVSSVTVQFQCSISTALANFKLTTVEDD